MLKSAKPDCRSGEVINGMLSRTIPNSNCKSGARNFKYSGLGLKVKATKKTNVLLKVAVNTFLIAIKLMF